MDSSLPPVIVAQLEVLGGALARGAQAQSGASLATHEATVLTAVRTAVPQLLAAVLHLATPDLDPGIATVQRRCPGCAHLVPLHSHRPRTVTTTCGVLTVRRPWYACATCHHGFAPADQALGIAAHGRLSAGFQAWVVDLGATTTYRESARLLRRLTGLRVAADTIRAHTTAVGEQVATADEAAIVQVQRTREAAEPVDPVPGTLVVQTDGAMVHYLDGWHEVKIGVVGGSRDGQVVAPSYVAARESADAFGPRLVAEAARRGALAVVGWDGGVRGRGLALLPPVHIVGDGAPWIWNLAADHFGERTEVLDFYHAAEHVWTVARAVYGTDTDDARVGATVLVRAMRLGGAAPVRAALAALPALPPAATEVARTARGYFTTNAARMEYEAIAAVGLPLGSGAVESAAKHVVQHRMKRPGQRWSERGGRALLALRGRHASGRPLRPAA
jgi:hypothetical protein